MNILARILVLFLFSSVCLFCNAASLSSRAAIERCEDLEKANEATIKQLKKQYGGKVTMERWTDGNTYFIISKGNTFARADLNGELISYNNTQGQPTAFFQELEPITNRPGENVILVNGSNPQYHAIVFTNGLILGYSDFKKFGGTVKHGDMDLYMIYPPDSKGFDLYLADGTKLFPLPIYGITYFEPDKTQDFKDNRGVSFRVPTITDEPYIIADMREYTARNTFMPRTGIFYHEQYNDIPGYMLSGGAMYSEKPVEIEAATLEHFNHNGRELQRDSVAIMKFSKPTSLHFVFGNEIAPDSVSRAWYVSDTHYIVYEKVHPDGSRRRGLIDMASRSVIEPEFEDIFVSDNGTIMVKENKVTDFAPYDLDRTYVHFPTAKEPYDNVLIKLIKEKEFEYSPEMQQYLTPMVVAKMYSDLDMASMLYDDIIADKNPYRNSQGCLKYTRDGLDRSINAEEVIEYYNELIPIMTALNNDNKNDSISYPQILLTELSDKFLALESAFADRRIRDIAQNEAAERRRAEKAAKLERMRKARERIAKLDAFQADIRKYQAIVSEGQARYAAKHAASSGGSASVITTSKASGGQSAPEPTDYSNRIIFLEGQIAEWKQKLAKAEKSYRDVMGSGEDSWEKKRVIDSKRNSVDECLQMIKQYEAELLSLKKKK